jgi:hypothetical protein
VTYSSISGLGDYTFTVISAKYLPPFLQTELVTIPALLSSYGIPTKPGHQTLPGLQPYKERTALSILLIVGKCNWSACPPIPSLDCCMFAKKKKKKLQLLKIVSSQISDSFLVRLLPRDPDE